MGFKSQGGWRRYALAFLTVGFVAAVTQASPALKETAAFKLYLAAVAITAWRGGWRAALLAIVLSGVAGLFFVIAPTNTFIIRRWDDVLRLGTFVLVAMLISALQASRERAETALRHSEKRLTVALDAARMGAWDSHMWTGEFWISAGLAGIFGRSPADFARSYEQFMEYVHPDDRSRVGDAVARTLDSGTDFDVEHRIVLPDGDIGWLNTRGRILYDEDGKAERLIGVAVDVTDRKTRTRWKATDEYGEELVDIAMTAGRE